MKELDQGAIRRINETRGAVIENYWRLLDCQAAPIPKLCKNGTNGC